MYQLYGHISDLSILRTFGCPAMVFTDKKSKDYMPSGMRGIFVEYVDKTWRVFIPSLHKIVESGNVRFDESVITKPGGAILADNREYAVEEFKYLIGTQHTDPDDGLQYTVKCIQRYRGNIVVDRVLSCDIGKSRVSVDTLYALDVAS